MLFISYIQKQFIKITIFFIIIFVIIDIIVIFSTSKEMGKISSKDNEKITNQGYILSNLDNNNANKIVEKDNSSKINIYKTNKWRIKIPSLNIDAPISQGTNSEALRRTVGHFEETDKWNGNVALAAHNRGYKCNFFQEIKKLKNGDIVIYSTEKGKREYKVVLNKVIKETDWTYIQNTKENRLTLITCEMNKKEYRRCVQAVEI